MKAQLLPDRMARLMSPADRKALGIRLPDERRARADGMAERELQRLCELELSRRGIPFLHLSPRAREKVGWPDLTFALPPSGRFVAVELKTGTGRLTDEQSEMLLRLERCGALASVVRSYEGFVWLLDMFGCNAGIAPHQARAIASRPECSCSASGYDPECKWEGHHHA